MTTSEALNIAQYRHPLDLVARVAFLRQRADAEHDEASRRGWLAALEITRNGRASS